MPDLRSQQDTQVRVLVVEDQAPVREAVVAVFRREPGFIVDEAGSLREARGMLEGIDVAILDLGLPDGNGADLIAELHAVSGDAVAVVFTSSVDPRQTENALQRGAAAALNKVDELDELLATVNRLRPRSNS